VPDLSAITAIASSLNAAVNITKAMKDLNDLSVFQSKVIELQSVILGRLFQPISSSIFSAILLRAPSLSRQ
jgi:hypothetical protein